MLWGVYKGVYGGSERGTVLQLRCFFFSSRRRHTRLVSDWSSDVCSSDLLSEASRLQIVCALKAGPKNVTEIIETTGLGQANVSKHLKMLAQAGIVSRQAQGVCAYYQISNPFIFELCELVCDALSIQIENQNEQFEELGVMLQSS